jgi:hypothetical protein
VNARRLRPGLGLALALLGGGAAHAADDAALAQCTALGDSAARLACYDKAAGRPDTGPTAEDFGKPPPPPPPEPDSVAARLVGAAPTNWKKGVTLKLDNGQTWKIVGDNAAYYPELPENAEVVITKSMFGAYWLELSAARRSFKVRRVQ